MTVEGYSAASGVTDVPMYHGIMPTNPDDGYVGIPMPVAVTLSAFAASVRSDAGGGTGNEWTATFYVRPPGGTFSPAATFQLNT